MRDDAQVRRYADMARRAADTGIAQRTRFLSPAERELAQIEAKRAGVLLLAWGGTAEAERCACAFVAQEEPTFDWRLVCLQIRWDHRYAHIGHRDLLGAALALGMDREHLGDLYLQEDCAYLFATREMSEMLCRELTRAGNASVKVSPCEIPDALRENPCAQEMRATLPSLRLDAVLGAAWHLSRGDAAELVRQGRVQVNHTLELRPDWPVAEKAILSVRGMGRCVLDQVGGLTKKGRISVVLLRY